MEPSWAILGVPTPRETFRPGPGEGVGGRVNPSPKGKKGVGRGSSLDHLRPKELVGFAAHLLAKQKEEAEEHARHLGTALETSKVDLVQANGLLTYF